MKTLGYERWCFTCKTTHQPTEAHPICPDRSDHLHEPLSPTIHMDHRGWRFFYPFYCFQCARRVCPIQFAFSRSCGACDCSKSETRIFAPMDRRIFAGKHQRLEPEKRPNGGPPWRDLHWIDVIDVNSDVARELIRNHAMGRWTDLLPAPGWLESGDRSFDESQLLQLGRLRRKAGY